ncbi:unnamed protein product [Adineta steineri]|uniref:Uncharacterized protein n=1 Tax=Adineta steineri TaxID=433720 RepID=A0A813Q2A3_9BILA|nr:unnamed protein product [Adineta steineri]CAF4031467.1 unnamed protein product [Adineta steineri]
MMEILTKLIIIFTISTICVQGKFSSTKIKDDAAKMVEIYRNYIINSPNNTVYYIFGSQCHVIGYCCNDLFNQTFNILDSHALEEKCINHPELILDQYKTECSKTKTYLEAIKNSSEYARFMKLHRGVPGSDELIRNWRSQMKKACNANELLGYYCAPDNGWFFQSCQEKMLRSLANQNGGKNYDAFLRNWINDFTTFNKRIAKEFRKST